MKHSIQEIADHIRARVVGDAGREIFGVAEVASATGDDLVFVEDERLLPGALGCHAGAVITGEFAANTGSAKSLLIVANPRLAFARAAALLVPALRYPPGIHSTAVIHDSVTLGKDVAVQPKVVLGEGVVVGARTRIGPGTAVGRNVHIGCHCNLAANVTIYPGTRIGDRVIIHSGAVLGGDGFGYVVDPETGRYEKFPQIGTLEIQDDVEIGCNTTIDRGALGATVIGRGAKIDNLVQIAHNCRIGANVVIAAQTGISGSSVVEDGVVLAGQVGIADHCRIEQGVILGAQSGVPSKKILRGAGTVYWGSPARLLKDAMKELAALSRLAKKS
jgi:UDP-3-O-[3-hydroxymyristoyl] glucosamine N-acyltransferase